MHGQTLLLTYAYSHTCAIKVLYLRCQSAYNRRQFFEVENSTIIFLLPNKQLFSTGLDVVAKERSMLHRVASSMNDCIKWYGSEAEKLVSDFLGPRHLTIAITDECAHIGLNRLNGWMSELMSTANDGRRRWR